MHAIKNNLLTWIISSIKCRLGESIKYPDSYELNYTYKLSISHFNVYHSQYMLSMNVLAHDNRA